MAGFLRNIRMRAACTGSIMLALAGCATTQPAPAEQANLANCTQAADATYQANNYNGLARTSQNGLLYPATPDHVFDAQRMGSLDARSNQIQQCMDNGNTTQPVLAGPSPLAPQIVTPPQ